MKYSTKIIIFTELVQCKHCSFILWNNVFNSKINAVFLPLIVESLLLLCRYIILLRFYFLCMHEKYTEHRMLYCSFYTMLGVIFNYIDSPVLDCFGLYLNINMPSGKVIFLFKSKIKANSSFYWQLNKFSIVFFCL